MSSTDGHSLLLSPALRRAASERIKSAKNLLKKMEGLRRPRKSSSSLRGCRDRSFQLLEISQPTAVSSESLEERLQVLGCVDISPTSSPDHSVTPFVQRSMSFPVDTVRQSTTKSINNTLLHHNISPGSQKMNHSSSALDEAVLLLDPDYKSGSFPEVIASGYIDMGNGSQGKYRTGSFNMGVDSFTYKDNVNKLIQTKRVADKENRLSIYDNMPSAHEEMPTSTSDGNERDVVITSAITGDMVDEKSDNIVSDSSNAQVELDLILHNLYRNINDLNQSLTDDASLTSVPTTCNEISSTINRRYRGLGMKVKLPFSFIINNMHEKCILIL